MKILYNQCKQETYRLTSTRTKHQYNG